MNQIVLTRTGIHSFKWILTKGRCELYNFLGDKIAPSFQKFMAFKIDHVNVLLTFNRNKCPWLFSRCFLNFFRVHEGWLLFKLQNNSCVPVSPNSLGKTCRTVSDSHFIGPLFQFSLDLEGNLML